MSEVIVVEWSHPPFFLTLASLVIIDLVLAGDNAIVIGMAARHLPPAARTKAIAMGAAAAIGVRAVLVLFVVRLLAIPYLLLTGGILLLWIAYSLLAAKKHRVELHPGSTLWSAIRTIVIADVLMGLDNVLAIAGASHGSYSLVVLGLLISVPVMVWGSTLVLRWMEQFPPILYVGAAVLAWTAARMITEEPMWHGWFRSNPSIKWAVTAALVTGVLAAGRQRLADSVRYR